MLVQLSGSAVFGVDAHLITIEVNVDKGIGYHLVVFLKMPLKKAITALPQHACYKKSVFMILKTCTTMPK